MLTKYITIKGEDVFASKPYKDLKVYFSKVFWKCGKYFDPRLKVAIVFSPTRAAWPCSLTTPLPTASWSALGRLTNFYIALRTLQKIMSSVRKCISTQIHTVCRDQVRMSTVARSLGRGRQNVLRCREHLLPAGVVFNLGTFWENNSRWWTRYEQRKWFPNVIARRTVSGRNHFCSFINLSAGLDIFQPFQ